MMKPAALMLAALAAAALATPAVADDPADMVQAAKTQAEQAPLRLGRRGQGPAAIGDWNNSQFRNVKANYKRFELVNDRVVFCGEMNAKQANGEMSGWTKFAYLPGDPPILVTNKPGLGLREVGPHVLKNVCETGQENWLTADYTPFFEADVREGVF